MTLCVGIDTRLLTKRIREAGTMLGKVSVLLRDIYATVDKKS